MALANQPEAQGRTASSYADNATSSPKPEIQEELSRTNLYLEHLHKSIEELASIFNDAEHRFRSVIGEVRPDGAVATDTQASAERAPSTEMGSHLRSISGSISDATALVFSLRERVKKVIQRCELPI